MKLSKSLLCFVCMFGIVGELSAFLSKPSTIVLQNNEFRNVVIAIHESIAEDKSIIDKLKATMTTASQILYKATKQRAYFKEVKILVPSTWSNDASYHAATNENLNFADIIITNPIRGKRSLPQTRSYDGCGKQGIHILLTKDFIDHPDDEPYSGKPAKYLIHSFAQFRWGVFQEYAEEGEQMFYMSAFTGRPEAIRCTIMIRGLVQKNDTAQTICYLQQQAQSAGVIASVDPDTGLYDSDCLWRPYPSRQRSKASIMDHQFIEELETFCEDDPRDYTTNHNSEAPSKHNRLCSHRSTWDIIKNTDDFSGGKNPGGGLTDSQLTPNFVILKASARKRRAVVTIDPDILSKPTASDNVKKALAHYIHETSHSVRHDLFVLQKEMNRTQLMPVNTVEDLNSVFRRDVSSVGPSNVMVDHHDFKDSHVIAITGRPREDLASRQTSIEATHKGYKMSTISINEDNRHINEYDVHHIGRSLGHSLLDRIRHTLNEDNTDTLIVKQLQYQLSSDHHTSGSIHIDETLSSHVTFLLHYEAELPFVDLRSPSDVIYGTESVVCSIDHDYKVIKFHFDFVETGTWKFTLHQSSYKPQTINVTVLSENAKSNTDPLVIRKSIKFEDDDQAAILLHVDVTQGVHPVIGLNVIAKIELPDSTVKSVILLDNGAGADISKDDGIYSRYFLTLHQHGLYHVTFIVSGSFGNVFTREELFSTDAENILFPVKKHINKRAVNGDIQRRVFGGTVHIKNRKHVKQSHDVIAPSRIFDLHMVRYIPYRKTLVISWTAPGDDLDTGKPFAYQVFIGSDVKDVRKFLTYVKSGSYAGPGSVSIKTVPAKVEATKKETLLLKIAGSSKTHLFSIRAVDRHGNVGEASNVASAVLIDKQRE